MGVPNFCIDLFSQIFLPHKRRENKLHVKINRFTVIMMFSYEPAHGKTNKMTCVPQQRLRSASGHPHSLIRVFACAQWVAKDPRFLHADSEDSDQTGRMPRHICLRWAHIILLVLSCFGSYCQ